MKKVLLLVTLCLSMFFAVETANADLKHNYSCDPGKHFVDGQYETYCYVNINATHPTMVMGITAKLELTNLAIKSIETYGGWVNHSTGLNLDFRRSSGIVGEFTVAKITYIVDNAAENCFSRYTPDAPIVEKQYCAIIDGYYYGKKGNLVTKEQYDIECGVVPPGPTCEIKNGVYYGPNGEVVTEEEYYKLCDITPPGPTCEIKDGVYYGPNGEVVTEEKYYELCDVVPPKGPTCEIKDGVYYGPNGEVVTEEKYYELCDIVPPKGPTCEIKDGVYYGPNGEVLTEEKYNELCKTPPKGPTCEIGKDGNYYGPKGEIISKEKYEELCIKNPQTGDATTLYMIIGGIFSLGFIYLYLKKNNSLMPRV